MPPEALTATARYGPSLDIISSGHLAIFVALQVSSIRNASYNFQIHILLSMQVFPGDLLEPTYTDPKDSHRLLAHSESEHCGQYIEQSKDITSPELKMDITPLCSL